MKKIFVLTLMVALLTAVLPAQASDRNSWQNLSHLSPGQSIEVRKTHGEAVSGKFASFDEKTIHINDGQQEISIARADVSRIRVHSRASHKAMWIGLAVGAGAGAAIGAGAGGALSHTSGGDFSNLTPIIAGAFAGVGALAGLAIGSIIDGRRQTIFSAK